jgi:uncharacterized protein YxjI
MRVLLTLSGMTSPRTRAILEVLSVSRGSGDELERGVLKVFGASSIDECISIYEMVGAAERSALDEAVARVEAQFTRDEEPVVAPQPDPRMLTCRIGRQLVSIGRSYVVEDEAGARLFRIAGKVRFARTFSILDALGNVAYSVRETLLVLVPTFVIRRDSAEAAIVKRTTLSGAAQEKFEIALQSGGTLRASGNLWQDEGVRIVRDNTCVATILRQQNSLREIFHATLLRSDSALLLAIAMSIVEMDPNRGST